MTRDELTAQCHSHLRIAEAANQYGLDEKYAEHMQSLLDLIIEELVSLPPAAGPAPRKPFNPEQVLQNIAIAIKHRTISHTHRWKTILYYDRLTCVPAYADVPEQIVLNEFTEQMVHRGFSVIYWNQVKQNVIKLYKEIQK